MLIQSADDHPITDSASVVWRIAPNGRVTANGVVLADTHNALQVAYVNQTIWRQADNLSWQFRRHPGDQLWPPGGTFRSPLSGRNNRDLEQIERGQTEMLAALAAFRADFDAYRAMPLPALTPVLTAIAKLQLAMSADFSVVDMQLTSMSRDAVANTATLVGLLNEILALIKAQNEPVALEEDLAHATHTFQPVPQHKG